MMMGFGAGVAINANLNPNSNLGFLLHSHFKQKLQFHTVFSKSCEINYRKQKHFCGCSSEFKNSDGSISINGELEKANDEFVVVNFYRFVFIKDPQTEVSKHLMFLEDQGLDIHGRIYLNEQGINAQYSGPSKDALSYIEWLREDHRFYDILVQISPSSRGHAFPRLKLRYKPSLVQLEGGISHLPLLDPSMRATPLSPSEWRKRLESVNFTSIVLDVRNGYEWDIGHFRGTSRPNVDCFRSTSFGVSSNPEDTLRNVDKEKTDVLMYCTGGIRCDVYSTILRERGFRNLYTLKGGISHFLEKEGPVEWVGNLFVFDSRLSLPPPSGKPELMMINNTTLARCYLCGSRVHELRHRNCANLDCNLLFLCCSECVDSHRGCCCLDCISAPRLRPVLYGQQRYQKWHNYRDSKHVPVEDPLSSLIHCHKQCSLKLLDHGL